jgi:hypothetical protein
MTPVNLKVGSKLTLPLPKGVTVESADPGILQVDQAGPSVTLTAKKAGLTNVVGRIGSDLIVSLAVTVTTA